MENFEKWPLLQKIDSPADLKALSEKEMVALAAEVREYLVYRVGENGGHLASNLGVVELTLALHRVFDVPRDHVIFDVGHQSYVHKLFTGRKERFDTLRRAGGLSGFTKREESECDAFGAGHSSTALSAALGLAEADALAGRENWTIAVVGDGAMTGGLAMEALNNCRRSVRLVLILNENEMSISENTGRLAGHLSHIRTSRPYITTKKVTSFVLRHVPLIGPLLYRLVKRIKRRVKRILYHENLFEHMGLRYLGPVDGHDLGSMLSMMSHIKVSEGSVVLHVKTQKGKGYAPAVQDPNAYHSLPPRGKTSAGEGFSQAMGKALCELAVRDERVCAITAAMRDGTGLSPFAEKYPKRFFDVGIAEGHALTFAAGLSAAKTRPVVALYSTFLQRGYDNILHDIALQHLPVTLCIDRAGLSAGDGPTHHGVFDVAMLSAVPEATVYAPVTLKGVARALRAALEKETLCALRYPSGTPDGTLADAFYKDGEPDTAPGVRVWDSGREPCVTVLTHGHIAGEALKAAQALQREGVTVRILLCEQIAPYATVAARVKPLLRGNLLFLEEEIRAGGFGMNLSDALARTGALDGKRYEIMALEDAFVATRNGEGPWQSAGLDAARIQKTLCRLASKEKGEEKNAESRTHLGDEYGERHSRRT